MEKLDLRLAAAADFVKEGTVAADVGTDHGYLPVELCLKGYLGNVFASDINEDPLNKAIKNADYELTASDYTVVKDEITFKASYLDTLAEFYKLVLVVKIYRLYYIRSLFVISRRYPRKAAKLKHSCRKRH